MNSKDFRRRLVGLQTNLYNFAVVLTSNRDDAADLLQDTTLKALDNEARYADGTNFKGWVFTIMRNIFINNYRRMVRSAVSTDDSEDSYQLNNADSPLPTPDESVAEKEIRAAIAAFPDAYRVPLTLYVSGYHYNEIAEKMHLPLGTVKSRIFYARRKLRISIPEYTTGYSDTVE